ncbi:MAG: hypothetical protein EPO21_04245 [Chloroflexota bacterium]|nr:MAG: hypothetical protein EPO21_04245 [Chloroflexota bacterium]
MNKLTKLLVGSAAAALLTTAMLAGLVLSNTVLAQTPPAGQTKPADNPVGSFLSKLAANLGISEDKLKSAIKDTENQIIDEGVQQGKITQDKADKLKERIQNSPNRFGFFGIRGPHMGGRFGGMAPVKIGVNQVVSETAKILGMSTNDIQTQLRSGESLADIAKSKNVDRQVLIDKLVTQLSAAIDQRVKDGKLTGEQATKLKSQLPQMVGKVVDAKHKAGKGPWGPKNGQNPGQGQGQPQKLTPGSLSGRGSA